MTEPSATVLWKRAAGVIIGLALPLLICLAVSPRLYSVMRLDGVERATATISSLVFGLGLGTVALSLLVAAFWAYPPGPAKSPVVSDAPPVAPEDLVLNRRHELQLAQLSAQHHDTLLWSVTGLSFAAQAFVFKFAIDSMDTPNGTFAQVGGLGLFMLTSLTFLAAEFRQIKIFKYERCKELEPLLGMTQHSTLPAGRMWRTYLIIVGVMATLWFGLAISYQWSVGDKVRKNQAAEKASGVLDAGVPGAAADAGLGFTVDASQAVTPDASVPDAR